jgi:WD40 repeat protein/DNA-binding HxlR family transcriptional regulator
MDCKEALEFVDTLVFAKTEKHLSDLQRLLFHASWSEPRKSYEEIANTYGYSVTYLKQDVGPKLWQLLSEVCEEKVKKTNFRAALERKLVETEEQVKYVDSSNISGKTDSNTISETTIKTEQNIIQSNQIAQVKTYQDWGEAPDVSIFYGRSEELAMLEQWIVEDHCRLVAILGMGGIGKTHLSVQLATNIQAKFEYVIWRSLAHAPPIQQVLLSILQSLTKEEEAELPTSLEEQTFYLINYLRKHRCLIVIDNLETILCSGFDAGKYQKSYQEYSQLFKLIGECHHNSCWLITSREKPQEIALMQGATLPVRCLQLSGLCFSAGEKLLQLKGCSWKSESECKFLIEQYAGNPLALKIVSAAIDDLFEGNTSEFIKHSPLVFDEISHLLEQQFQRISDLGKTFLYWLAINQEPVSASQLQNDLFPQISGKKLIETLKSLAQRCLIEKKESQFYLQPVVKEYFLGRLIEQICQEIETGNFILFNSHCLLQAQAKEYIRNAQIQFIVQPLIKRLLAIFKTPSNLAIKLKQLIEKLQKQSPLEPGYAAGNILNLLCQLKTDLTNYDFSNLTVWQAYLQDVNLHNVNFTNADLSKSVFAEQLTNILSVAFSSNGQFLATGDSNGEIRLWRVGDRKLLLICKGHAGWVSSVDFSPDGLFLSSGSSDQTVKLWNITNGKCLKTFSEHSQRVRCVTFSPDGKTLASGSSDYTIRLWDVSSGQCLKILSGHSSYIWSVSFSPEGTILASGSEDRTVKLWQVNTGECLATLLGHSRWVRSVAFSPDGKIIASGSGDRTIKLWDLHTGQCLYTLEGHTERVRSVAFSPDGKILASASGDHTIRLWNYYTTRCSKTLHGHSSRLGSIAFSPDGKILASGGEDRALKLWDVKTGQCLTTWQGYAGWVQSVAFSPDGKTLASGSEDRAIRVWNISPDKSAQSQILQGHHGWVCAVAFSPDGKILASASSDYTLRLWNLNTGNCLRTLLGHTRWIRTLAFSSDGQKLVSGSGDYSVKLWDVTTGTCIQTFKGHTGWIWSVAFSPDGVTIASGSEDQKINLWDTSTGRCKKVLTGHSSWVQSVAFSPDGKTLASGSCDGTIRLWDVDSGKCFQVFWGHSSWVQSVAFSPEGKILASGSCDQTVKLWDLELGRCLKTLRGHLSWVWSVVFSPDGNILASGSQDETVKLWELNSGQCLQTLRNKRPLEGMSIKDAKGLTKAQIITLTALGSVTT